MSWLRGRLSCWPTANATEGEESIAVRNEVEWGVRINPTTLGAKAPPPLLVPRHLRGPLPAPAKAPPPLLFKAPPPLRPRPLPPRGVLV